ncbi:MAG: end-binding protein Ku [Myxococcales bacterium]|nr:end-binding protein Ku [Myxococcales bacterium]
MTVQHGVFAAFFDLREPTYYDRLTMAARSIGSGTISFGLVSIPIKLYTAVSPKSVSFNMLHKTCGGRLKQQLLCPVDNVIVERSDTIRGFEYARDQYVKFTDEELKSLEAARTDSLELVEFVPASTVDFLYIEKTYFLGPDKGGDRAYRLLSEALEKAQRLAVGRFAQRGKDNLVIIRPYKKGLILHECYYADEVRSFDDVETGGDFEFKPIELELANKLIEQLDQDTFEPSRFRDTWADKVRDAVEKKVAGEEVQAAPEAPKAQIIDLLEALKRSVAQVGESKPSLKKTEKAAESSPAIAGKGGPKKAEPREKAEKKKSKTG